MAEVVPISTRAPHENEIESEDWFEEFWTLYPRKIKRKPAYRAWLNLSKSDRAAALAALVHWRRIWLTRGDLEYVRHPTTWLHDEGWHDELPAHIAPQAHAPAAIARQPFERVEMPQSVREALAKLKAQR